VEKRPVYKEKETLKGSFEVVEATRPPHVTWAKKGPSKTQENKIQERLPCSSPRKEISDEVHR
jgi:hypothetical protein